MKRKRALTGDNTGLTLVELLVGIFIGSAVLAIGFSGALFNRNFFVQDLVRNNTNQSVRTAVDMVGLDIRQVGENLGTSPNFPALQVTRTATDANSVVIVRQNPLVALRACEAATGTTVTVAMSVTFSNENGTGSTSDFESSDANNDGVPDERALNPTVATILDGSRLEGCTIGTDRNGNNIPDDTLEKWVDYNANNVANGQTTQSYFFDSTGNSGLGSGSYFIFSGISGPTTTTINMTAAPGLLARVATVVRWTMSRAASPAWPSPAPAGSYLYVVETRQYQLGTGANAGTLLVTTNGDSTRQLALINGLQSFNVTVNRATGSTTNTIPSDFCWQNATSVGSLGSSIPTAPGACGTNNQWSRIQSVDVSAQSLNQGQGTIKATSALSERFLPRSVFSF